MEKNKTDNEKYQSSQTDKKVVKAKEKIAKKMLKHKFAKHPGGYATHIGK